MNRLGPKCFAGKDSANAVALGVRSACGSHELDGRARRSSRGRESESLGRQTVERVSISSGNPDVGDRDVPTTRPLSLGSRQPNASLGRLPRSPKPSITAGPLKKGNFHF